ncbi:MAG TPA: two-component regulator propeller domain-containing protein [Chryseolinea sp.]|nr:two-component regulator propeller domain-containing protein [Chryseolinea sp.]HPM30964.1 two-component regulator propeller domain-containing protein [Chryseolinea sp.]
MKQSVVTTNRHKIKQPSLTLNVWFTFLIFVVSLIGSPAFSQHITQDAKFRRLAENVQLSNLNITTIAQDSKGFLWVGTLDGLNRFDGYDFKTYRSIENDSTSLVKDRVETIYEDSKGILWISTLNSGLQYYNRSADSFCRIPEFSQRYCQVFRITEDSQHNLWIGGTYNEQAFVAVRDHRTGKWEKFPLFRAAEGIYSISQISEHEFWLGSQSNGLFKWNRKTNVLEQNFLHDPNNPNSLPGNDIREIIHDKNGIMWIATHDGGLCKFNLKNNQFTNFTTASTGGKPSLPNNTIRCMIPDGRQLWIATENGGLSRMDVHTEELTNFLFDKANPNSIINNSIWSIAKDRQGRIWVGSFAKGLCVLDVLEDKIPIYDPSLENDLVNVIFEDSKNRMWIGTEDGLILKDDMGSQRFLFDAKKKNSISSNAIDCIYEDRKHRIWIGVWNGGINRFDENSETFIRYNHEPNRKGSLTDPNVFNITESSQTGELLVSTFGGLNILKDEEAGIFENPFSYPHEGDQFHFTLFEDKDHNIWVGARSGLSIYSLETNQVKHINIQDDTTKTTDQINCIFEDHNKNLWFGSSGGLHQMISQKKFITYTIKDGLPVDFVQGILEDSNGNLWLGTSKGLSVFNPTTKKIKTFDESDGLLSSELRRKAFLKKKNGQMFVGGKGVNVFYPDSIISNLNKPSVFITDLKIFNQSIKPNAPDGILKHDITETKEIYLNHDHYFITLHYVGINFTSSYKNQYAYKLEGFENNWINVGTQRFATFTNLDPGKYTFRVKASNNDDLWNEEGTSVIIHILPPWWKTWWARSLFALGFIGMVTLTFLIRNRSILKANKELEYAVNQKTKELQKTNLALQKSEEEIIEKNKRLTAQSDELATQNEELLQSQEEVSAQRDLVEKQNENLELEVSKRTNELVEYNQQLEQFAFIAAHNLRAPVARILGLGHLLGMLGETPEKKEEIYPKLINTTRELDGVVKDLNTILDFRKNSESHLILVDLTTEVSKIMQTLEREITNTHAVITIDFAQVDSIRTVKPYLESILYNLISNAIKYRDSSRIPAIQIKTEKLENEICLRVADNGLGIDLAAFRDKLFTLYSRFHIHLEGKGLGLYLVKTQITALGGRIEIESEVNKGTTFSVYFKN